LLIVLPNMETKDVTVVWWIVPLNSLEIMVLKLKKAYPYTARTSTCASVDKPEAFKISGYTDVPAGNCDELAKALTI